jgi:hypothetical protein
MTRPASSRERGFADGSSHVIRHNGHLTGNTLLGAGVVHHIKLRSIATHE